VAACFVALSGACVAGYYTLASASLMLADLPVGIGKKLPRYPTVPAVRMGAWPLIMHSKDKVWVVPCWLMRSTVLLVPKSPPAP
jgi:hypothetical protein